MLTKKTAKNQLTLPKDIVREFPGIEYFDAVVEKRRIVLTPVRLEPADGTLETVRRKMKALGITEEDVRRAVSWARGKKARE
ncbi:MAG: AbrB/MazE/SpoVT family DNA-binding domain-containing protein [Syntrophaceae bacterium]|nr:AbrB/MazE/SpoVT family DNA-binding domain-containing protein [Syntrophaceae bacterium]